MNRILIVGCGDIALRAARLLSQGGHCQLFGLVRDSARYPGLRSAGITPLLGDLDDAASLHRLSGLAHKVLHLAPPPNSGTCDTRTRNLLAALARGTLPRRFIYVSTSGVYGDCGGARVSETRPLNAQSARAQRRVDAERQIRTWARRNQVQAAILRVPGIYAAERLPLERLLAATPAIHSEEDSYTNHIHADDLAHILLAALRRARPNRVYHASDDSDLKMGDYFDAVADAFGLVRPPRLPRTQVEHGVPPALWSFMNESRRLNNVRMKRELEVVLRYPAVGYLLRELEQRVKT